MAINTVKMDLRKQIERYERQYPETLEELEARLERGEGSEHPDWEDSIAWRTSVEILTRDRTDA